MGTIWPCFNIDNQAEKNSFMEKNSCCIFGGISLVYYKLLKSKRRDHYWGSLSNIINKIEPSTQGKTRPLLLQAWQNYSPDNARPHVAAPVKTYLETFKWEILLHPPYSPDIAPSDYHLFRSMTHGLSEQHFTSYEDTKNCIGDWIASKNEVLPTRYPHATRKMGKSSG